MFHNYLKIAFRRLLKYKKFSLINILGLSIGLASFLIILLWIIDELSYDRFHENADDTYLIIRQDKGRKSVGTTKLLIPALVAEYPEIVTGTSYLPLPASFEVLLKSSESGFNENLAITDAKFFEVFSFDFVEGGAADAFEDPTSIVLSKRIAEKYFGEQNALGQSLELTFLGKKIQMRVVGVLREIPRQSHIRVEIFVPYAFAEPYGINWDSWNDQSSHNYIRTNGSIAPSELEAKILACKTRNLEEKGVSYSVLPLTQIHLHSSDVENFESTGDIQYVYFLGTIAVIILLIACMNYMNLANALALKRMREIGIQKIVGAGRSHLFAQHIGETLLLTFLAMILALLLVEIALPLINRISGKPLAMDYANVRLMLALFSTTLLTGLLTSLFPGFFISGFQPIQAIKGQLKIGHSNINFRNAFTVLQFALTTLILVSTFIVFQQLRYVQRKNLGFNHENVICLPVKGEITTGYTAFKQQLLDSGTIQSVCRSEPVNGNGLGATDGIDWEGRTIDRASFNLIHVDNDFAKTYQIEMLEGRFYDAQFPSDATQSYVINEAASKVIDPDTALHKEINLWGRKGVIVGITKNFHFDSLHSAIEPLIFRIPNPQEVGMRDREISVRIAANSMQRSLEVIKKAWTTVYPDQPFDFYVYHDFLKTNYQREQRMGSLFGYFACIAIFIACLGLYGLIAFSIEQRVKEIGVHKVLGATVGNIVWVLTHKFLWLVFFSNLIAWPVTYTIMHRWLQDFAYRMHLTPLPFVGSALIVLSLASATICWQAIQAASQNPVTNLRNE